MTDEQKKRGRPSLNTRPYSVKIEGQLADVLDTKENKNRYVNQSLREKMERDGDIPRRRKKQ
jgi:hypothetical protein